MSKSPKEEKELEALIKDLLRDRTDGSIEAKLRNENKKLGDKGKVRDKTMDIMELVSSYQENGEGDKYRCPFKPGDIVTWKKGFRSRSPLKEGQLAIVLTILEEPFTRKDLSATSPFYGEVLDVRLGWNDDRGIFTHFLFNSKRFELFNTELVEAVKRECTYENTFEKLTGLVDIIKTPQRFKPGDVVVVRSEFEADYRHILLDTDTPCVVINYLKEPIQNREDGPTLDMTIGIKYTGDTSLTLLNVESFKFVYVELI